MPRRSSTTSIATINDSGPAIPAVISQSEYALELLTGGYTVVIYVAPDQPPGFKEGDAMPAPKVVLPDEYTARTKSTFKATVTAGQDQPVDFDLK